ncbi:sigma 54-interacting transcriptional regulator [Alkalihalobacillus sp. MEB130]|uniref:sigma 54-interacting transcriptional regulator n=1 Tax=Alkalihalobacillus sp. MEB130 TaxID=2976704 RepID=UPI0028E07690|nr:sigma 54-interacting transcriptional regulator [Alkalihalobacillus sp. MEB130]MDT8860185.1 sigma 54-interacting transcriptional regulator [Alkalihalobacillus sp. MEB130]
MATKRLTISLEDFISTFQNIIVSNEEMVQHLNLDLYVINSKKEFVCYYDQKTRMTRVEHPKWIKSLQHLPFNHETRTFQTVDEQGRKQFVHACPIFIDYQPDFQLIVPSHKQEDELQLSLQILADYIGYLIVNQRTMEDIFLKSEYQEKICEATSEGYLTINKNGELTYLNRVGGKILDVDPKKVLGKHVSEIFDYYDQMIEVLHTGEGWQNRDFFISRPSRRIQLVKSSIPIVDDDNQQLVGSIFIFREMKVVRDMVGNIVGNKARFDFSDYKHTSKEMSELVELAQSAAKTDSSILIESESGTGKEIIAQAIHNHSHRCDGPFITIDCSSIPRDLVESELFGYVEGAFTGARKNGRFGKFELAHGGTIFLDEIGEMPLEMQSKLLRVIQNRTVTRIGGNKPTPINFRIIAATNRNLEEEISNGNFRLDLFYRINVIHLSIPPLRQRLADIPILANVFIEKTATREGRVPPLLSDDSLADLEKYSWPGNVRELENVMERATLLAEDIITPYHLPKHISTACTNSKNSTTSQQVVTDTSMEWEKVEYQLIVDTLQKANKNKSKAAKMLGISRSALYDKLKKYQIQ